MYWRRMLDFSSMMNEVSVVYEKLDHDNAGLYRGTKLLPKTTFEPAP